MSLISANVASRGVNCLCVFIIAFCSGRLLARRSPAAAARANGESETKVARDVLGLKADGMTEIVSAHELIALAADAVKPSVCTLNANGCASNPIHKQQAATDHVGREFPQRVAAGYKGFCTVAADNAVAEDAGPDFNPL